MLRLDHLTAGYGATTVLRDVSLCVPAGATVALLGANGAGKTTLLRCAGGVLQPTAGRVTVTGHDVTGSPPHRLVGSGVCFVPEGRGVFGSLTVRDNLSIYGCQPGVQLDEVLTVFPSLNRRIDAYAGSLSGGEQQMLALARAYVQRPAFALLDEVSMGLAPLIVDQVFEILELFAAQGTGLLLVEQYVGRALALADYVYILNRGEVVFAGDPGEVDEESIFATYVGQHP